MQYRLLNRFGQVQLGMWDVCIICGPFMQARGRHLLRSGSFPHLHCIHQPAKYQPAEWGAPGPRSNP